MMNKFTTIKMFLCFVLIVIFVFPLLSCGMVEKIIENRKNKTYIIHFNSNGGEGQMDDYFVESGDTGWLPKCQFIKEGYECVAWAFDSNGTTYASQIDNLTFSLPLNVKNGGTIELYAIWTSPDFSFELITMGYFAHAKVMEYSGDAKDIIFPAWYDGSFGKLSRGSCKVTEASSELFMGHTEIETVKNFPISNLNKDLFNECTSLKSIEMYNDIMIETIGKRTFYNCSSLQSINLTTKLNSIGEEAFYMCTSIEKLIIPSRLDYIEANAFYGWNENQTIEFTKYSENPFGEEWLNGCKASIIWSGKE